ncbi:hypothetical protein [Pedobacter sp. NJ-S-72]
MAYSNEQLTEMVNDLSMTDPQSLKLVLRKIVEKLPNEPIKTIPFMLGKLIVFKSSLSRNPKDIEPGDIIQGFWGVEFITAKFLGGNENELTNYKKLTITTDEN